MPEISNNTDQLIGDLLERMKRVERAILGDDAVGHPGLPHRVKNLEDARGNAAAVHGAIDDRRHEGDKRAHDRIDAVEAEVRRVERKIDRLLWAFMGAGAVTGGGAVGLIRLFS